MAVTAAFRDEVALVVGDVARQPMRGKFRILQGDLDHPFPMPVVVPHSQSLRAIVEKNHCGIWYQDNKPEELAPAICELNDPAHRSVLGKNGRKIVQKN